MAKELKKIFPPGTDQVEQTYIINAWHVSQSVDALTGEEDYDITISGSLTVTGSVSHDLIPNANGAAASVLVRDNVTGEYKITGSYSVDYVYSASFDSSSAQLDFYGSGSAFNGSVDLSFLSDSVDYVYSASFDSSSGQLDFYGSGSGFTGTVDLSSLTGSVDYVYSASFDNSSGQLDFYGSGSGYNGSVDLSSLTGSTDYVSNVNLNGTDLEFTGVGDAFAGTVPLASLTGSTDYVSNVTLNTSTSELEFTGVGNGFDGDIDLSRFYDNQGGFTFRYSGSVVLNETWPTGGFENRVISTAASHLTASGANEWHFSDIGRNFSSQFHNLYTSSIFSIITTAVQDDQDVLVRVYDDENPRYQAFYTNVGPATIGNVSANAGDLVMDLEWIGGTGFGDLSGTGFNFPNGTNPNNTNVSFAFIGGSGGAGTSFSPVVISKGIASGVTETVTGATLESINGGAFNFNSGGNTSRLTLDFDTWNTTTDFMCQVINYSSTNEGELEIVTPSTTGTYQIKVVGYISSTNERFHDETSISQGTGYLIPRRIDWSGMATVTFDNSSNLFVVHCTNFGGTV